jgi:hypothetical protein
MCPAILPQILQQGRSFSLNTLIQKDDFTLQQQQDTLHASAIQLNKNREGIMDVTTIRTILVYLTQPEDTSAGGQSRHGSIRDLPEKTLRSFDMIKTCLWICLAVIVSLSISSFR